MTTKLYIAIPTGSEDMPLIVEGEDIEEARETAQAYRRGMGRPLSFIMMIPAIAITKEDVVERPYQFLSGRLR